MNEEQKKPGGESNGQSRPDTASNSSGDKQPNPGTKPVGAGAVKPVSLLVAGLLNDDATDNPVIVLKSQENDRVLLMWIGDVEAEAIDFAIRKVPSERPLAHQLMLNTISTFGGILTHVVIDRLKNGTYYASLYISTKDKVLLVDARPSDAIILALIGGCHLYVDRSIFEKASTTLRIDNSSKKAAPRIFEINIQFSPPPSQANSTESSNVLPMPKFSIDSNDVDKIKKQLESARFREENT